MDYVVRMMNVSKTFGEVDALWNVDFEVGTNEIVGLVGDNGAGKSTLVKIMTGYHQPDPGGEFYWKGKRVRAHVRGRGPPTGDRGRLSGKGLGRPAGFVAQHLHGPGAFEPLRRPRFGDDAGAKPGSS